MEQEIKLAIEDEVKAAAIWDEMFQAEWADQSTAEKVVMKAVYFDTEDLLLSKNDIAVRVRNEGDGAFATLKWGGKTSGGFHERNEVNVPISGEEYFMQPPADLFKESEEGLDLVDLVGDKKLINLLETRFLRRRMRLTYKDTLIELAIDTGSIITDKGEALICELELELYAGTAAQLKEFGSLIAEKYGLAEESRSKFARGLMLLAS